MGKSEGSRESLEQRVLGFIQEHHLVPSEKTLLVAVSGGPDSVCLLHILAALQNKLGVKLHVAHLDHQLRGAESQADAHYVSNLTHQLGIPATIEERDVKSYQARERLSLEEAAREMRYSFLAEVAKSIGTSQVATGHTIDDHIETVLMHLIRGTGTTGLRGLQPITQWRSVQTGDIITVIRPLIQVSREETVDYCHNHDFKPRLDATNLSLLPLRNRIRFQLLPLLMSYNPRVAEALLRTARIAGDDLAFLDTEISRLWDRVARKQDSMIIFDKERLLELPSALQRHLLRTAIGKLLGTLKDIETRHIEGIMAALSRPAGRRISLPEGLIFTIEYDRYLLAPKVAVLSPFPILKGEFPLRALGKTLLPGWHIEAVIINREQVTENETEFTAYLDLDKTGNNLLVRSRQTADRFQPLGLRQPKKLGEFMIDARIPRSWRQRIPIVCSPEQIIWVVGWRIDERVKVKEDTKQVLRLEFKQR
jgi:tRNA(Ile)-lysidine synthase